MKRIALILSIVLLASPSIALAQQGTPPPTPLPIETEADQLQAAADAAIANAQAAVSAAQQAAQQAAQAKAQAAAARERANALDAQAALSRAAEAEQRADAAQRAAESALASAREALTLSARAVTHLKEVQAAARIDGDNAHLARLIDQANANYKLDAQTEALDLLTARLQTAEATLASDAAERQAYQFALGVLLILCAVAMTAVVILALKTRPVSIPVTVQDDPSPAGLTIDNLSAEVVPGATVSISPALRLHIDQLIRATEQGEA